MGEENKEEVVFKGGKDSTSIISFLKLEKSVPIVLCVAMLIIIRGYLKSFNYLELDIIIAVFLVIFLLSELMAIRKDRDNLFLVSLLFSCIVIIITVVLFKMELSLPVAHLVDYESFPYPRHSYISHISSYIFIFLTLCFILVSFVRMIIATRNMKSDAVKINKATELIKSCLELEEFRLMLILSFWLVLFVMFLAYSLMKESNEEGAGLYIIYTLVILPVFFLPVSLIGIVLATRKMKKSIMAIFIAAIKITVCAILLEVGLVSLISMIGGLV